MIFLLDGSLPPPLAQALQRFDQEDCQYRHCAEVFGAAAHDDVMLSGVQERGWFLVTHDVRLSRQPAQRQALLESGIGVFVFTGRAERTVREFAAFVLECAGAMIEHAAKTKPPFIWGISDQKRFNRLDRQR